MIIATDSEPRSTDTAVILVNLGTPTAPTAKAVSAFLSEFLSDQRVVELPALLWKPILHGIVIPLRSKRVAHAYESIWEDDSPLRNITKRQCAALQQKLDASGGKNAPLVRFAMTYQGPSIAEVIDEVREAGITKVVVLPLYPQYSATTTAAISDQLAAYMRERRDVPNVHFIRDYHDHPAYIKALANSVREYREAHGASQHLLMSFHGIPEANVKKGDPYDKHCERTASLVAAELGLSSDQWTMSYQSRFGKAKWLEPYTNETLEKLARDGVSSIDILCPAFSVDCLETLEEMSVENRDVFMEAGGEKYNYIPCLNDRDDHIFMMARVLKDHGALCKKSKCGSGCTKCRFS